MAIETAMARASHDRLRRARVKTGPRLVDVSGVPALGLPRGALHRRAFGAKRQLPSARGFEDRLAGLGPPPGHQGRRRQTLASEPIAKLLGRGGTADSR